MNEIEKEIAKLLTFYKISSQNKEEFMNIIEPIIKHDEFKKRMDPNIYPHHGNTSLGNHIISDAIVTYKLALKKQDKGKDIDIELAVLTAMFHDLYELPWQNACIKKSKFINKHGFVHPIEAVINASIWYPSYFQDETKARKLVDGIVHHMYPFPVRSTKKDFEDIEINNYSKLKNIDPLIKKLLLESCNRSKFGGLSLARSKFIEGKVMSKADKTVTCKKEVSSLNSLMALVTGKNSDLNNYKKNK